MQFWKWTLSIHCSNPDCKGEQYGIFQGSKKAFCIADARQAGWSIGQRDFCPTCAKERKSKLKQKGAS